MIKLEAYKAKPAATALAPYRLFFPLGVVVGVVAVGFWPAFALGWFSAVHGTWHAELQLQGFLFAFVLGFLLTAWPRFTMSSSASSMELWTIAGLYSVNVLASGFERRQLGHVAFFATISALLLFMSRRFQRRRSTPPDEFIFVAAGVMIGWIAALTYVWNDFAPLPWGWEIAARRALSEGMMLMLALGIGGKLGPMILGYTSDTKVTPLGLPQARGFDRHRVWLCALALTLAASFPLEYFGSARAGLVLRAAAACLALLTTMPLWRRPQPGSVLVVVLRFALWMMVLSPCAAALVPQYRLELLHALFIGGFGVLILVIATRITLSHGNFSLIVERRSKALVASAVLLIVAMLVRGTASFFPAYYVTMLGVAGIAWMTGLIVWGSAFGTKAIWLHPAR